MRMTTTEAEDAFTNSPDFLEAFDEYVRKERIEIVEDEEEVSVREVPNEN